MIELPIYTEMVPFWRMLTGKRVGLQRKTQTAVPQAAARAAKAPKGIGRYLDYMRFRYPLKFDFCRMTLAEMTGMMDKVIAADRKSPREFKPMVAIGHTKDLVDFDTVEAFLRWLRRRKIAVLTLSEAGRLGLSA